MSQAPCLNCPSSPHDPAPSLPDGLIPRTEKDPRQIAILRQTRTVTWIMVDLDDADSFVREGRTALDVFPEGHVVTTSTIHDRVLARFHPQRELEVVRAFQPSLHVPCDRPVYAEQNETERRWLIEKSVEGTLTLRDGLAGGPTRLLPLIKGVVPEEWSRSYEPLSREGITNFAFYGKQYFGAGVGKRDLALVHTVRSVVATLNPQYLLLIGYQSPARVTELPPKVRAFAGQRWRLLCRLGRVPSRTSRAMLETLIAESRARHSSRQETLGPIWTAEPLEAN
jgi:hypothetical protein